MSSFLSEKEPLLARTRKLEEEDEISTHTSSSQTFFKSMFNPFQVCFPISLRQSASNTFIQDGNDIIDYSDDDDPLPDLPSVQGSYPLSTLSPAERLLGLRRQMRKHKIGVYIIPSEDEHHSEETALADKRREFISGFTGSAGVAVVTLTDPERLTGEAILSTDGRYFLQAQKQLDPKLWKLNKQNTLGYQLWYQYAIKAAVVNDFSNVLSCDPRTLSLSLGEFFNNSPSDFQFKPFSEVNLVDEVWGAEKPKRSLGPIYQWELKYSGEHSNDKIKRVRAILKEKSGTHYLVTELDSIAWLFNLRADTDIPFAPVFFSYAIVTLTSVTLYVDHQKLDNSGPSLKEYLSTIEDLTVAEYEDFYHDAAQLHATAFEPSLKIVLPTKEATSWALYDIIPDSFSKRFIIHESIIANLKIFKNKTESHNAKIAQYKDSLAFIMLTSWLEHQLLNKHVKVSEYDASRKIYSIRKNLPNFKGLSYETISSTGPNAAIIHYAPSKYQSETIDPAKVYLLDSGAHYLEGTTDITRTYLFDRSAATDELKKYYTLVLKGHLAVAMAKFPAKSRGTGIVLDSYSRQPLWNHGLDYAHGLGHGVGSFGLVHEGPLYISPTVNNTSKLDLFQPGAILTDEPGYYVDGEFGFRVESELEVIEFDDSFGKTKNGEKFLGFKYLTKVPFAKSLIDTKYLSQIEIQWINDYHQSIWDDFSEKLLELNNRRAYNWLHKETSPIS
ncbi:hypothetical protein CANMA_001661 [Candida margitis]|uniref:uncharacterized protein n=1 Tax=Candida margitis TaxID=1775924 RepID=UPI002227ED45|nr:uncharacterized protein CANMA_001661 [Candida margitis]KAI5969341.1 hypothetical protein CANMA_001661 [Candida margitis]